MMATLLALFALVACENDDAPQGGVKTFAVTAQLHYPSESGITPVEGVEVTMKSSSGTVTTALCDASGRAEFSLPEGIYEASASDRRVMDGYTYSFNALVQQVVVAASSYNGSLVVNLDMVGSRAGQLLIKELYVGGCPKDDGSGAYQTDKYMVIYNNSSSRASVKNFCIGMAGPYNAHTSKNNYVDGVLYYADLGYTPTICAYWYMQQELVMEPYTSKVIALNGAIDHTLTYTRSVDLSEADYCTYDPEVFTNTSYYPTPSEKIPSQNYLKANFFGKGNAWPISQNSPALFIFSLQEGDPTSYGQQSENRYFFPGEEDNDVYGCTKIPNEWIMDAVEIFSAENVLESYARFNSTLDAGYVVMTGKLGYSIYRNVDREATEALPENAGKLLYGYGLGTVDYNGAPSTDPSGIDAELSAQNGAHILYLDNNNSSLDFHQRQTAALKH